MVHVRFSLFVSTTELLSIDSFELKFQNKYVRNKTRTTGGRLIGFDDADRKMLEIIEKFFPNILTKPDRVRSLDETDDTAMDEDSELHSVEFSDVDYTIKVEHVENEDGAVADETAESGQEYDEIAAESKLERPDRAKEPNGIDETVGNFKTNGRLRSSISKGLAMDGLEREMAEMQNYKIKLELIKMERELYLKPSKYTKDIVARQGLNERR